MMYIDAEFDVDSDFAIKHGLNPWLTDLWTVKVKRRRKGGARKKRVKFCIERHERILKEKRC